MKINSLLAGIIILKVSVSWFDVAGIDHYTEAEAKINVVGPFFTQQKYSKELYGKEVIVLDYLMGNKTSESLITMQGTVIDSETIEVHGIKVKVKNGWAQY